VTAIDNELPDTAEGMEARETADHVPLGWKALFYGLILWGVYYLYAYSPWSTGWTQAGELEKVNPEVGGNVFMTVLFTALPTAAAVVLYLLQRGRKATKS
jgi:cbb3-type cytochrome oxidase subunit FixP-like protein